MNFGQVLYVEDRFRDPNWTRQAHGHHGHAHTSFNAILASVQAARKLGVLAAPSVAPALLATRRG